MERDQKAEVERAQDVELRPYVEGADVLGASQQQRQIAEVQAAVIMARKFPRNVPESLKRIKVACQRIGVAKDAHYAYRRGSEEVTGISIRLAEVIAQNWGNLQFGVRELERRPGLSIAEAYCWDLETNVQQTRTFQVPHVRERRAGNKELTDPRDVYELVANMGGRRMRACIEAVIPVDVQEEASEECEATLRAKVDLRPERVREMVDKFATVQVTEDQLRTYLQRPTAEITPAQFLRLGKVYNALKDGFAQVSDYFPVSPKEESSSEEAAALNAALQAAAAAGDKRATEADARAGGAAPQKKQGAG